jgi:predicted nucleic acid-binding protein
MRYVVLDTDVASRAIKGKLTDPLAARLTGMAWCLTFVTVGELWQWATTRSWGPRTREDLELWLGRIVVLDSDDATSRTWGRISAGAVPTVAAGRHARDRGSAADGEISKENRRKLSSYRRRSQTSTSASAKICSE